MICCQSCSILLRFEKLPKPKKVCSNFYLYAWGGGRHWQTNMFLVQLSLDISRSTLYSRPQIPCLPLWGEGRLTFLTPAFTHISESHSKGVGSQHTDIFKVQPSPKMLPQPNELQSLSSIRGQGGSNAKLSGTSGQRTYS